MHVLLVSACEKRALKKTRTLLDSYAPRIAERSWAAPMTREGLTELHRALKRIATRQTAVACYINDGRRRMRLLWTVGARGRFLDDGRFAVGSTQANRLREPVPDWIRAACLLAGAAGDLHDIGKASRRFQNKLNNPLVPSADPIRHEWLSVKLLQLLRQNGWDWAAAWQALPQLGHLHQVTLGERNLSVQNQADGLLSLEESVDYLILTHHGLLSNQDADNSHTLASVAHAVPTPWAHVRPWILDDGTQLQCAGALDPRIFEQHQKRMQRLRERLAGRDGEAEFFRALSIHARAALIFADHVISAQQRVLPLVDPNRTLFANTIWQDSHPADTAPANSNAPIKRQEKQRVLNQTLLWHLEQVGEKAARVAQLMHTDLKLSGLSEQTVERAKRRTANLRFDWQNKAANALQNVAQKHPNHPALVLNIAGTGMGKTRMNLRAACILAPDQPRLAIALNLRSLTLQTGHALRASMDLGPEELAVVIGDPVIAQLHQGSHPLREQQNNFADDDENPFEPVFEIEGELDPLPEWLQPLFKPHNGQTHTTASTVLAAPLLVSTIDYLIAAGEPSDQGHHVKALLRLMSSDLILDEIDSYDPKALVAVLRLIQLSALYGRRVICSSATLSHGVACAVEQAFRSGLKMRQALYGTAQSAIYAIFDHALPPQVWHGYPLENHQFTQRYQKQLNDLSTHLQSARVYRLAELQPVDRAGDLLHWQNQVAAAALRLHARHHWILPSTGQRVSIGLIRVARVKTAFDLAVFLAHSEEYRTLRVACYHASDWLMSRWYKEKRLDTLLSRQSGDDHLLEDAEILQLAQQVEGDDVILMVIATPVEEVGRDHDFDWGVIDVSSAQSLVQTAGRINRHRQKPVTQPNIAILQYNAEFARLTDKEGRIPVFTKPGYEDYDAPPKPNASLTNRNSPRGLYAKQDLATLLPWNGESTLPINARLRVDTAYCQLARLDEGRVLYFVQQFFAEFQNNPEMAEPKRLFVRNRHHAALLGTAPYLYTPLREPSRKAEFYFAADDEQGINIQEQVWQKNPYGRIVPARKQRNQDFTITQNPQGAWLFQSPTQLLAQSELEGFTPEQGCAVALRQQVDPQGQPKAQQWCWDIRFGIRPA